MKFLLSRITIGKKYTIDVAAIIWFLLAAVAALLEILRGPRAINNYFIFKNVFFHILQQVNLYTENPAEYFDTNHYGPVFGMLIAPFAPLPYWLGCFLWCMVNAWFLYYAISRLPISRRQQLVILLISVIELMTAIHSVQFNPMLTAWMILAYILVDKQKDTAATFFIAAGFLVKIYGIAALACFFFSKHKMRFVLSFTGWLLVLLCLPMLFSSPAFVLQSYSDWYHALVEKDMQNAAGTLLNGMQDISVQGIIRRVLQNAAFPQLWVLAPAAIMVLLPLVKTKQYAAQTFRLLYLALSLITVVIFSSSAESPTYVIAVAGAAIWFVVQPQPYSRQAIALLIFVLLLTSLSTTDLFPRYIKVNFIVRYSLKALPCFVVWLVAWWQLMFGDVQNWARIYQPERLRQ